MDNMHQLHNTVLIISKVWLSVMNLNYTYKLNKWDLSWDLNDSEIRLKCSFIELPSNSDQYFLGKKYIDVPLWLMDETFDGVREYFERVK